MKVFKRLIFIYQSVLLDYQQRNNRKPRFPSERGYFEGMPTAPGKRWAQDRMTDKTE